VHDQLISGADADIPGTGREVGGDRKGHVRRYGMPHHESCAYIHLSACPSIHQLTAPVETSKLVQ